MERLIEKYLTKLDTQGLASRKDAIFLGLDADLVSTGPMTGDALKLSKVFGTMNITTLLLAQPAEPYRSIIEAVLAYDENSRRYGKIFPMDCEMRTLFHDIPVVSEFSPEKIAHALSERKAAIIRDRGIVTYGVVTPEQAFITFSSICFSTFVKYFYDSLVYFERCETQGAPPEDDRVRRFDAITHSLRDQGASHPPAPGSDTSDTAGGDQGSRRIMAGQPGTEGDIIRMLAETGRAVVEDRLVDSFFGNLSYVHDKVIYISQTGSSLDELESCVDAVPLEGTSSVGITASSELSAHKEIYRQTGDNAILHGHPKFSVILSMHCLREGCNRDLCHKACREKRDIRGVPVVSGEVGTGPTGLLHTVPAAMKEGKGVIVYGHGVFTSGRDDFRHPFSMLAETERSCRREYFERVGRKLKRRG